MRLILSLCAALSVAGPVFAGQAVALKADTADADGLVTLGDLFDGAGKAAGVPLATRTGQSVILDAGLVQLAARRAGLDWANAEGLKRIVVHAGAAMAGAAAGPARGNVDVLTYTRSLAAGEIVQPADLVWSKAASGPADAPSDPEAVIGMAAKHALRAGAVVSARDVGAAMVVRTGDIITVTYEAGGVSLSMQGKAMAAAGVGETLAVQNVASKKVVQTLVTAPGQAVVGPAVDQMKSARTQRYAAAR